MIVSRSLFAVALLGASLSAHAASTTRGYRNDALRVRSFEPPVGWEKAPQQSYTRLLASYSHAGGGRLTLSAQKVAPSTTAEKLVHQSRTALEHQGFADIHVTPDGSRVRLEALLDNGRRFA